MAPVAARGRPIRIAHDVLKAPGDRRRWISEVWVPFVGSLPVVGAVVLAIDRGDEVAALFLTLFALLILLLALNNAQHIRRDAEAESATSETPHGDGAPPETGRLPGDGPLR
jgi:hypothetical protein